MRKLGFVMSDLPYFKFMVQDYLSGNIQKCDMETQGIFVNLCSLMWKEGGQIEKDIPGLAHLMRIPEATLANAWQMLSKCLILLETEDGFASTKFILEQMNKRQALGEVRADAGRKGGKVKTLRKPSKSKAKGKQLLQSESESESESDQERVSSERPGWNDLQESPELRGTTLEQYIKILQSHPSVDAVQAVVRATIDASMMAETIKNPAAFLKYRFNGIELGSQPRAKGCGSPVAERIGLEKSLVRIQEERANAINFCRHGELAGIDARIKKAKGRLREMEA